MKDKSTITGQQFMFSVACFFQSTTLLTSFFVGISKQNSWIVVLVGSLLSIPMFLILLKILQTYPKKNLIQINDIIFGKIIGKIVSCFYLFFFLCLTALNFRDMGIFINQSIMHNTPISIIVVSICIITMWAVKNGLKVVVRFNVAFSLMITFFIVMDTALVYDFMDFKNIMPFMEISTSKFIQSVHIITTIPFGEIIIIGMILPYVDADFKTIKKGFFIGFVLGAISLLIVVFREILVLGNTLELFTMPSFETLKLIDLGETVSRVEIVLVLVLMVMGFSKAVLLLYATVTAANSIFGVTSFKASVLPFGLIAAAYTMFIFESMIAHHKFGITSIPFLWFLIEYILPFLTIAFMYIRRIPQSPQKRLKGALK